MYKIGYILYILLIMTVGMNIMKTITSSDARRDFSSMLSAVAIEPVSISKQNKEVAVMLSSVRYKELKKLEDFLYGKAAELAIQEGFASKKEADDLLHSL
mgnify:FL=1